MNTKPWRRCSLPFLFPAPLLVGLVFLLPIFAGPGGSDVIYEAAAATFDGSVADVYEDGEMLMESEISRRFRVQRKDYITYPTIERDVPDCGGKKPGLPNSRCLLQRAHLYNRGCLKIYGCDWPG